MAVSYWATSAVTVALLVTVSPCRCVLRAKKLALRGPMVGVSAKKFAQRTKNGPQSAFYGVLGEFFRGNAGGSPVLGELFRWLSGGEGCWVNFVAHAGMVATYHS